MLQGQARREAVLRMNYLLGGILAQCVQARKLQQLSQQAAAKVPQRGILERVLWKGVDGLGLLLLLRPGQRVGYTCQPPPSAL